MLYRGLILIFLLIPQLAAIAQYKHFSPFSKNIMYDKGMNLYKKGDYKGAIGFFDQAIEINDANFHVYFRRSYANYYLGEYRKALADIEKAFDLEPIDHRYFYLKGQYYDKLKQYDLAEYYLDMAIRFQPERFYYYNDRAAFRLEMGKYREALEDFNVLIGANPYDYNSYYGRGLAKFNLKMKTEACLDWLYARDKNENCNQFFFYKCTDLDLRGKSVKEVDHATTINPKFEWKSDTSLIYYLSRNVKYPLESFRKNKYGMVLIKFVVTTQKKIGEIEILHSPGKDFDHAIITALKESESFWLSTGLRDGKPVDFTWYLPVSFRLSYSEYKISELIDSMNFYLLEKDYSKLYETSKRILLINPLIKEAQDANRLSVRYIDSKAHSCSNNWLHSYNSRQSEIYDEIWITSEYVKIPFNETWQVTSSDKASFIRISEWNSSVKFSQGPFTDYTTEGIVYATGEYDYKYKQGDFLFYYPNGNLRCQLTFDRNQATDTSYFYYTDGTLHHSILLDNNNFKVLAFFDSTGKNLITDGTGQWEFSKPDYKNEKMLKITGGLKNYEREGVWKFFIGDVVFIEENYNEGRLTAGYYYENGKKIKIGSSMIQSWIVIPFSLGRSEQMEKDPDAAIKFSFYL